MKVGLQVVIDICLGCYALAMLAALWRLVTGPAAQDRILAIDFLSMLALMWVLVDAIANGSRVSSIVAVLMAAAVFVSTVALAKFLLRGEVIE